MNSIKPAHHTGEKTHLFSRRCRLTLGLKESVCLSLLVSLLWLQPAEAIGGKTYIRFEPVKGGFPISQSGKSAPLYVSSKDLNGVRTILKYFQIDIENVTGSRPEIVTDQIPAAKDVIIVGTLGKNPIVDRLVREKKIDVRDVVGKWETYLIKVVEKPMKGVDRALVIAGSDKRGTIYGMFDISENIGVSPWYWWADVSIKHHKNIYVLPEVYREGPPSVKYRGIFLNDEAPDLTNWIYAKFGTVPPSENPPIPSGIANYGRQFYTRIFELLLRLKANYLWPAMWNNAFNEDDPENPKLADEYGIVMGTSHQEPMLRAQKEWDRRYLHTIGTWNYAKYPDTLQKFWRDGIRRNKNYESIITIGLRGANDTPMAPGGPEASMNLLENIVGVQRKILSEEMNPDVTKVPQLWCLYKEVLDYYNAGMRVPDDVTLLWPDDNWGNNRRLPTEAERKRSGGAGIYYHFDYHGGPRSYQWVNTDPIPKIWEEMSRAKEYGADRIWIVNVGHFKGYEFPLEYFTNLAWDSRRWTNENLDEYTKLWAAREFGSEYAGQIARIITEYTKFNGRRKPELLSPTTYSLVNYHEAETVVGDYDSLALEADAIQQKLPEDERNSFYELVLFPTKASSIVNELYVAAGRNALYAKQGRASANEEAARTRELFSEDTSLMRYFNYSFMDGRWEHFMDQSHLGYTNWQDPPSNSLRAIHLAEIDLPDTASLGVEVEGSTSSWPGSSDEAALPGFDVYNQQRRSIDIFSKGKGTVQYTVQTKEPWILVSSSNGEVETQKRIWVSIDWKNAPNDSEVGTVLVSGRNVDVPVKITTFNPAQPDPKTLEGFVEANGYVSMEAEHFTNETKAGENRWIRIPDYGHTLSGMATRSLVNAPGATPGKDSPCLEYRMFLFDTGKVSVEGIFGPTLNFLSDRNVRYAVAFDDDAPQEITLLPKGYNAQNFNRDWEKTVEDNGRHSFSAHTIRRPGFHTLKVWMIDPGVVLEKLIVNCGGVRPSDLGPPESYRRAATSGDQDKKQ